MSWGHQNFIWLWSYCGSANCCNYPSFHFTCLFFQTNLFRGIYPLLNGQLRFCHNWLAPGGVPGVRYAEQLSGTFYLYWERFWLGVVIVTNYSTNCAGGGVLLLQVAAPAAPLQAEAAPGAHLHTSPGPPRYTRGPGSHSCQVGL